MKNKLILTFCILIGLAWFMAVDEAIEKPKRLSAHLGQAEIYESQGIYVDAIAEYEAALEYEPDDPEITYKMAKAYRQLGDTKQYVKLSKDLISLNPEMEAVLDDLVEYYLEKKDRGAAVKYVAELVESQPENECASKWLVELKGSYTKVFFNYSEVVCSYNDTLVVAEKDEETGEVLYGVVNALGEELLPVEYEAVQPFSEEGYALVVKEGKALYVDEEGNTRKVPDMTSYESVGMINNGRVVACQNGKFGLLDDMLNPKTDFVYEDITLPSNNLAAAKQGGKWALIGRSGKEKTEFLYDDVIRDEYGVASRQKMVLVQENNAYHVVNAKGETIGAITFEAAKAFPEDGYAAVCQNGKWGFINQTGELVIDCQFEDARSFSNGYAAVCQNGKWGFVDVTGNVVIQPEFERVTDMTAVGTVAVYNGEWQLIQLNLFR